jgi:pimeloyl-ACP methyl ester carboxylesterase
MTRIVDTTLRLRDGRSLGYLDIGEVGTPPVILFHGSPGSRLDAFYLPSDELAATGVRMLAPDRPGLGRSDPRPRQSFREGVADAAGLADALGLEKFAVIGVSGGGPYAAACAEWLPERLTAAALVSGVGPSTLPGSPPAWARLATCSRWPAGHPGSPGP